MTYSNASGSTGEVLSMMSIVNASIIRREILNNVKQRLQHFVLERNNGNRTHKIVNKNLPDFFLTLELLLLHSHTHKVLNFLLKMYWLTKLIQDHMIKKHKEVMNGAMQWCSIDQNHWESAGFTKTYDPRDLGYCWY